MRRDAVRDTIDRLRLHVVASDAHGITIKRSGIVSNAAPVGPDRWFEDKLHGTWMQERWRVYSGGGIAGNSGVWWLMLLAPPRRRLLGPYKTQKALVEALRKWRRWELP